MFLIFLRDSAGGWVQQPKTYASPKAARAGCHAAVFAGGGGDQHVEVTREFPDGSFTAKVDTKWIKGEFIAMNIQSFIDSRLEELQTAG